MKKLAFFICLALFWGLLGACASPCVQLIDVKEARYSLYLGEGRFFELPYSSFSCKATAKAFFLRRAALGEEVRFSVESCSVEEVLTKSHASVIKQEQVGDTLVWYCKVQGLFRTENLPFGTVNMQIARTGGVVTVGFPVIYGGF